MYSDCKGTVLPKDLCFLEDDSLWTCGRCGHSRTCSEVEDLLQQAGEELATLSSKELPASLTFLDQWRGKLHRHHYYLTEVSINVISRNDTSISDFILEMLCTSKPVY